jgi:ACS family hexuronate transporter-like MFS transporter
VILSESEKIYLPHRKKVSFFAAARRPSMKKKKNRRWYLVFLLTLDTINNYLDRMTLPVAIIVINQSFEVTDSQHAFINSLFFLAYAIMYAGGGRLMDKLGTYWGFLSINIFWGLAVLAHGIANSFIGIAISRFFLGIGEGGGFPASSKAVSEWFPAKERSTAFGIFNTGSSIGSVLAVPLFSAIMYFFNWRSFL